MQADPPPRRVAPDLPHLGHQRPAPALPSLSSPQYKDAPTDGSYHDSVMGGRRSATIGLRINRHAKLIYVFRYPLAHRGSKPAINRPPTPGASPRSSSTRSAGRARTTSSRRTAD